MEGGGYHESGILDHSGDPHSNRYPGYPVSEEDRNQQLRRELQYMRKHLPLGKRCKKSAESDQKKKPYPEVSAYLNLYMGSKQDKFHPRKFVFLFQNGQVYRFVFLSRNCHNLYTSTGGEVMLNQCVLVGRVKELPDVRKTAQGNTVGKMILEVDRSFRNEDGVLASDLFQVILCIVTMRLRYLEKS